MNLRIADKVFPGINHNGGKVWVDKNPIKMKQGSAIFHRITETVDFYQDGDLHCSLIIAQTPDLNLEGVPVVEVKTIDLKQEVLKFIKHWELYFSSPKVGQPPSLQILKDAVDKEAQSKGAYTEQQVLRAIYLAKEKTGDLIVSWKYTYTEEEILASIQPEIVVETEIALIESLGIKVNKPITEQRNGRTYFKIKQ